ncbi:MAG: helix-turn-helix transcriptional regulator [Microbacteriaceae bacterium]|nr:helix-turn-helix transcriptional regulator [Microbacteriaceae bacterium]
MFKGLAHPVRVRILEVLASADEVPVADLMRETGLEPAHLSQHLAVLRRHRLVVSERRASYVFYRLAFPEVAQLLTAARRLLILALEESQGQLSATGSLPEIGLERAG